MDIYEIMEEFYGCIKKALEEFAKTEDNKDVYAMVFDCTSEIGQIAFRYNNRAHFTAHLAEYERYYKEYGWSVYGLHGSEYEPGEFAFIDYETTKLVEHYFDSYYYYSWDENYFGEGEPEGLLDKEGNVSKESETFRASLWDLVIKTIERLMDDIHKGDIGIDISDDFIFFHCDHDQSYEERDKMISKTVSSKLMDKLINKSGE